MVNKRSISLSFIIILVIIIQSFEYYTLSVIPNSTKNVSTQKSPIQNKSFLESFNAKITDFSGSGNIALNNFVLEKTAIAKGENIFLSIKLKALVAATDLSFQISFESIESNYGLQYMQEINGEILPLSFTAQYDDFCSELSENEIVTQEFSIGPAEETGVADFHFSFPLNRGSWNITSISILDSEGESSYYPTSPCVINIVQNTQEHVVFAYFVHNNIPTFSENWHIRDSLDLATHRMENDYPFKVSINVIEEDNSWDPADELYNNSQLINDAWKHVGRKLKLKNSCWDFVPDYDLKQYIWTETKSTNGGYDIIIIITDRPGDHLGIAGYKGNWAFVSGGRYDLLNFHISASQFDNIIQHELSHVFGAHDRDNMGTVMDTTLIFNGTHLTSPCLENTDYYYSDLNIMIRHCSRFDGPPNPVDDLTFGREKTLSTIENTLWKDPKIAIPKNNSIDVKYYIAGLKNSNDIIALYCSFQFNDQTEYFTSLTSVSLNITDFALFADKKGDLHLAWVAENMTDFSHSIFYKSYSFNSGWQKTQTLKNSTNCQALTITADSSGKVSLVYNVVNSTSSILFYCTLANDIWSKPIQLPNTNLNCSSPALFCDDADNIHFIWAEYNQTFTSSILYYQNYSSTFSPKKLIYQRDALIPIINPLIAIDSEEITSICWEVIEHTNSSLLYCELDESESLSPIVLVYQNTFGYPLHSSLLITENRQIHLWWDSLNIYKNQSYIIYAVKDPNCDWSYNSRYSLIGQDHYNPYLELDAANNIILTHASNELHFSTQVQYSRLYSRLLYTFNYQVTINSFNITTEVNEQQNSAFIEFKDIISYSTDASIGQIDSLAESHFHSFGLWRIGEGFPIKRDELDLDTSTGRWYGSTILEELLPGTYIVIVAFMDANYIYSGHYVSSNQFVIEDESPHNSNSQALLLGLSIGIPVFVVITTIPIAFFLVKKKREKVTSKS